MADLFKNWIDGKWVESSSGKVFEDINPANTDDLLGMFQSSTRADARSAIEAAARAFPSWRAMPAPSRARFFAKALSIFESRKEEMAMIMTREEGKIFREALGEVAKGLNLLDFYVGEGYRIEGDTLPSEMPSTFVYTIRQPLGVACIITPWNFPFSIPIWKIVPALIAGNTVVFKPASLTPLLATRMIEIFHEAGLPKGVLNMVTGAGGEVGDELVINPLVRAVSFTGSTPVGRSIYEKAARGLKKVTCEMGGKNPLVVMEDADLNLAVEGCVLGAFGSTGQRCTATSRAIVVKEVMPKFTEMLLARTSRIRVGPGMEETSDMGPAVSKEQLKTDLEYVEIAKAEGGKLLFGGKRLSGGIYDKGFFMEPTIVTGVTRDMRIAKEEVFGPVLSVMEAEGFEDALELANAVSYGLSSSIYARDAGYIMRFVEGIEAGMVHINSPTIGGEAQLPFGGIKESGVGDREMGKWGINFFTELKTVFFDYTGKKRESLIY